MNSIIIPAYNEESRITAVLLHLSEEFPGQEIIVVCDGVDGTKDIVENLSIKNPNIQILNFKEKLGKGGAIIEGFRAANGEKIGFIDADESVNADEFKLMFDFDAEIDGVIASRRLKTSKILVKQPIKRRIASKCFNIFVRILFGLPFKDTQCGAKVFKREAILDIINDLETGGFEIDVEILWRLKNNGYIIIEYPITWKHSEGSKFNLNQSTSMLTSLLKMRFK
ncbi:Glycosyl transferase, family 2 [Methanothrix harundinacea 6Ac]|uniref:dolichyl-phosphate beta-glucosyltransferase n=2 Tax=Methanothrix harundinacea TaxID=301375 RepID=G7WMI3_METH6|nr:Glycosyl transferase, family 2 [Methanothrix harundinacea 6Ac]